MEARLKGLSSGEGTPASISGRTECVALTEEDEPKEWVAQVEPGVLIAFLSLPDGGNDLKRIRFRYLCCTFILCCLLFVADLVLDAERFFIVCWFV